MEEQKEKEKGVGCVQCTQPTPFGAEREVCEPTSPTSLCFSPIPILTISCVAFL